MVLGLRGKAHRSPSVHVDYLIHIHEIKPWPPSQSLRTLKAVVIQWEHGDKNSGSTNQAVPSLGNGSGVGDGRIEFNECFRLSVKLIREISAKGGNVDTFQKNCIRFSLYEPRHDNMAKGQSLGTATVDLAVHGIMKASVCVSVPINCKRSYRNTAQPLLFLEIQQVDKVRMRSLSRETSLDSLMRETSLDNSLMRETSLDRSVSGSVSALMSEEYAEEAETASFTDDDVSSFSSLAFTYSAAESNCSSSPKKENGSEAVKKSLVDHEDEKVIGLENKIKNVDEKQAKEPQVRSCSSSKNVSSDVAWISRKIGTHSTIQSSTLYKKDNAVEVFWNTDVKPIPQDQAVDYNDDMNPHSSEQCTGKSIYSTYPADEDYSASRVNVDHNTSLLKSVGHVIVAEIDESTSNSNKNFTKEAARADVEQVVTKNCINDEERGSDDEPVNKPLQDNTKITQALEGNNANSHCRESLGTKNITTPYNDRVKHLKSVRCTSEPNWGSGSVRSNHFVSRDTQSSIGGFMRKNADFGSKGTTKTVLESKLQNMEERVEMLEGELREAAAIEIGLYSVVAEHGSSFNKVHAPARRLYRFYHHACEDNSVLRRGSAAKSAISGLILVSKACGNDVPRLTFWLSNCVMLRATVSNLCDKQQFPLHSESAMKKITSKNENKSSSLKQPCFPNKSLASDLQGSVGEWEIPHTFTRELEKVEAWIFSRIVESVWWQTFAPNMQPGAVKSLHTKIYQRTSSSGDEEHRNFSLELWKKAFRDACERICPVRAGGHECGCLHPLSKLIMEQCVARLDVAMFNAILRESADEIPADPVSDPIGDAEVLPISAGKASFGTGALLKNVIGNWLRLLTDLCDIDGDGLSEDDNKAEDDNDRGENHSSSKPFHLLNSLSDVMMLPKDLLLSKAIRKEVCPMFGPPLIRRVLDAFVADEFCPDLIPDVVLEAFASEDLFEAEEETVMSLPYPAAPIQYIPPSAASVTGFIDGTSGYSQMRSSRSSLLDKSYTSDDELEELGSPFSFILSGTMSDRQSLVKPSWTSRGSTNHNAIRYRLLREAWTNAG